jgi:dipeptidyl aminopeptidase/acylaminoacyl peptidase
LRKAPEAPHSWTMRNAVGARGEGRRPVFIVLILAALILAAPAPLGAFAGEPPPLEAFARLPDFRLPTLSPDGARYAAIEPEAGRGALVLHRLDEPDVRLVLAAPERAHLDWFDWAGNDRLIYTVSFPGLRGAAETIETRLYVVSAAGGRPRALPQEDDGHSVQVGSDVIGHAAGDWDHVLVNRPWDGRFWAFRLDLRDGSLRQLERGTANTASWLADSAGQLRVRVDVDGLTKSIYGRVSPQESFHLLLRYELDKGPAVLPLALDPADPAVLYVASDRQTGRLAIYRYDMARNEFGPLLFGHPSLDLSDIATAPDGRIIGYIYRDDLPQAVYLDDAAKARQARIDRALPGTVNPVVSESEDGRRALVIATGPQEPGSLYLDEEGRPGLRLLARNFPDLARSALAPVESFRYAARDGVSIPAYLMRLAAAQGRLPLVLLVHGGPSARDDMSFDMIAQFLASRGYAVLQPNFRGSTGYGRAFEERAVGSWGRAMIDDLADGARALIAKGVADPARICVVGASYGGYAALMSAVRDPALYRCVASISGLTDLSLFLSEMAQFRFADARSRAIRASAPDGDFDAISPLAQAARITVPVLLVHGQDDRIVLVRHSELMDRALRRAGKPHELVLVEHGDHNYSGERLRGILLGALERFLGTSLAGGA